MPVDQLMMKMTTAVLRNCASATAKTTNMFTSVYVEKLLKSARLLTTDVMTKLSMMVMKDVKTDRAVVM